VQRGGDRLSAGSCLHGCVGELCQILLSTFCRMVFCSLRNCFILDLLAVVNLGCYNDWLCCHQLFEL